MNKTLPEEISHYGDPMLRAARIIASAVHGMSIARGFWYEKIIRDALLAAHPDRIVKKYRQLLLPKNGEQDDLDIDLWYEYDNFIGLYDSKGRTQSHTTKSADTARAMLEVREVVRSENPGKDVRCYILRLGGIPQAGYAKLGIETLDTRQFLKRETGLDIDLEHETEERFSREFKEKCLENFARCGLGPMGSEVIRLLSTLV